MTDAQIENEQDETVESVDESADTSQDVSDTADGATADEGQAGPAGEPEGMDGAGQAAADFSIQGRATHGVDGWVNLFGIESPGLTASLAIADRVFSLVEGTNKPV